MADTDPAPLPDPRVDALEARLRRLEWQSIGADRKAEDDARLSLWWGLCLGLYLGLVVLPFVKRLRTVTVSVGSLDELEQEGARHDDDLPVRD